MASTMQTGGAILIGYTVAKKVNRSQMLYLTDEMGTERSYDASRAYVWGNPTDALWAAQTQASTGWTLQEAFQEW